MSEVRRVTPEEARRKVGEGTALLVCAYESEDLCVRLRLPGSLTLAELPPDLSESGKELIFYCR